MRVPRIFVGSDEREAVGLQVFFASLLAHASSPVEVTIITERIAKSLGIGTDGTNAFTKSRFIVPYLSDFEGHSLWLDGADMMLRADVHEIAKHIDYRSAVQVVKHDYTPQAERKYIGTEMEAPNVAYPRKNWSSVMLFWNEHAACRRLTPEYVASHDGQHLHRFQWCDEAPIGDLPAEWNWLDELGENPRAKVAHWTNGIPGFTYYKHAPHSEEWWDYLRKAQRGL